jgi:hypothetical protein
LFALSFKKGPSEVLEGKSMEFDFFSIKKEHLGKNLLFLLKLISQINQIFSRILLSHKRIIQITNSKDNASKKERERKRERLQGEEAENLFWMCKNNKHGSFYDFHNGTMKVFAFNWI